MTLLEAIAALDLTLQVEATKMLFFAEQADGRPSEDWMPLLEAIAALDLTLQLYRGHKDAFFALSKLRRGQEKTG